MATIFEDFRRFSVHDLKRLGMLRDGFNGRLNWTQDGEVVSTIGLYVRLLGNDPAIMLRYTLTQTGELVSDWIRLHYQESNLPSLNQGYWMFVCPATGRPCRVLYLDRGHFKSRKALPTGTIYKCQTYTPYYQIISRVFDYSEAIEELTHLFQKPYAKASYRGKPTRKLERLMKIDERYGRAANSWCLQQRQGK